MTAFAACSGATTADVLSTQIGSVSSTTGYVTISVGGNDADFAGVVYACLVKRTTCARTVNSAKATIRKQLPERLDAVYGAIRLRAPSAVVLVVGYPHLFKGTCGGLNPFGADQDRIDSADDVLDGVVARAAAKAHFRFVDPRPWFEGHSVCGHPAWINRASVRHQDETYHPNVAGYDAYATLVVAQLR